MSIKVKLLNRIIDYKILILVFVSIVLVSYSIKWFADELKNSSKIRNEEIMDDVGRIETLESVLKIGMKFPNGLMYASVKLKNATKTHSTYRIRYYGKHMYSEIYYVTISHRDSTIVSVWVDL